MAALNFACRTSRGVTVSVRSAEGRRRRASPVGFGPLSPFGFDVPSPVSPDGVVEPRMSVDWVWSSLFNMSAPENRRADAHQRCAFLNGNLEVPAHPHRQLAEHGGRDAGSLPFIA